MTGSIRELEAALDGLEGAEHPDPVDLPPTDRVRWLQDRECGEP